IHNFISVGNMWLSNKNYNGGKLENPIYGTLDDIEARRDYQLNDTPCAVWRAGILTRKHKLAQYRSNVNTQTGMNHEWISSKLDGGIFFLQIGTGVPEVQKQIFNMVY
ncbi:hypothetical protein ACJX0J_017568, partial [Zea mays]